MGVTPFQFLEAVKPATDVRERLGTITDVVPLKVLFDGENSGEDEEVAIGGSYISPIVGHRVVCIKIGNKWTLVSMIGGISVQAFSIPITFTTGTSLVTNVSFPIDFPAAPTSVCGVISSGSGSAANWFLRTNLYTASGFQLILNGPSAAWTNIPVNFIAVL